jgi:aminopeptidase N
MLRHQVGDEVFWRAINRYLTSHAYGPVDSDDLRTAFEETTGKDLKSFFQQWVYGSGFPVFQVSSLYDRAAGRVVVTAREIQPRDSMTGFFDVDADVEVRTDSGVVRFVVPVRNGSGEAGTNVKAPPRSVRWDKGGWILDVTDFPRSTRMLQYQLISDDDVLGRIEAVDALGARQADQSALNSLIGATRNDKFWAVRARAAGELGAWSSEPSRAGIPAMRSVKTALLAATRDPDARVREAAARALGGIVTGATVPLDVATRLRELARRDVSLLVRSEALAADIKLEKAAAVPLARELMAPQVWANINRTSAVTALKGIDTPEARALVDKYATPQQ